MNSEQRLLQALTAKNATMRASDFEAAYDQLLDIGDLSVHAESEAVRNRAAREWSQSCGDALTLLHPFVELSNAVNSVAAAKARGDDAAIEEHLVTLRAFLSPDWLDQAGSVDPQSGVRAAIAHDVLQRLAT